MSEARKTMNEKPELPLVINGAVQAQIAVRHEEQAVNHAHVKIGLHNAVHVFQRHRNGKQQVADAFQQGDNPEPAKCGFCVHVCILLSNPNAGKDVCFV